MNPPPDPSASSTAAESPPGPAVPRARVPGSRVLAIILGILLPVVALGTALLTDMCQGVVNPIPTPAHAFAIGFVSLAHLCAILALGSSRRHPSVRLAGWLNSTALAIGLLYAVYFAPITPFAFVAILFFGLGLLPLAPLASVIAALCLRAGLRRRATLEGVRLRSFWPGLVAGVLAMVAIEGSIHLTNHGVRQLARGGEDEAPALRLLRSLGNEDQILRGCHLRFQTGLHPRGFTILPGPTPSGTDFQLAYYRLTGRPFNSVPAPRSSDSGFGFGGTGARDDTLDWTWDESLGAQQVGRRLRALYLTESRLDARVEGDAALGYLEWTLVFRNDHAFDQREARAVIQLPPGAAVSRLTLWVHGEEREAAWGGTAKVIEAYRSVAVVQRRDPVLVTAQGPDRVLVQCFPIEPRGGLMKVRLGITMPLVLAGHDRAHLLLPRFIEQNFSTPDAFSHLIWAESDSPLAAGLPALRSDAASDRTLRGALGAADLATAPAVLSVTRSAASSAWTPALRDPAHVVTQTIRQAAPAGPVALVLSGSATLAPAATALADALASASATPFTSIHVAGDLPAASPANLSASAQARWLRAQTFVGGQDDTAGLSAALDELAARSGGTLVWLHAGQPLVWQDSAALEQRLARRAALIRIVSVPIVAAPNLLLEKIAAATPLSTYPRLAALDADLARLIRELRDGRLVAERASHAAADFAPANAQKRASDHLSRLWARDEVYRLLALGDPDSRDSAQRLALATQIVTPVSGAVVLETQAQYDAAGLSPSDERNSPIVPEPATYGLLMAGALLTFTVVRRRRRHAAV